MQNWKKCIEWVVTSLSCNAMQNYILKIMILHFGIWKIVTLIKHANRITKKKEQRAAQHSQAAFAILQKNNNWNHSIFF